MSGHRRFWRVIYAPYRIDGIIANGIYPVRETAFATAAGKCLTVKTIRKTLESSLYKERGGTWWLTHVNIQEIPESDYVQIEAKLAPED